MQKSNSFAFVFLLLVVVLLAIPVSAGPSYDVVVWSKDYQPGRPVYVNVTGPSNMSIVIRITDWNGIIVSGRDAQLDSTGNYSFGWSPSQDGDYNATVQFSTGLSITRKFTIQDKVTSEDIAELYDSLFRLQYRLFDAVKTLTDIVYLAIGLSVAGLITTAVMYNYVRPRFSRTETEFEKFLKEEIKSVIKQRIEQQKKV